MRVTWLLLGYSFVAAGGEKDAEAIKNTLMARHLPYGTVMDPFLVSATDPTVTGYTRCGDSALWTGAWLAAESYRYAVTHSSEALDNVKNAIDHIKKLMDVTGGDVLARCAYPVDSQWAGDLNMQEAANGIYTGILNGQPWFWVGHTSRDEYLGVFFGLTVAYSVTFDDTVKGSVNYLATRMLDNLQNHTWAVRLPDGSSPTTFLFRPDQQLALLKLGRRANSSGFGLDYALASATLSPVVATPIQVEVFDPYSSYFKFNLDYMTFYMLLTGGDSSWVETNYRLGYNVLRAATAGHGNAFFDIVDRAVNGGQKARDEGIASMLDLWLKRPRVDITVDLRGVYPACGDPERACFPIPIPERTNTDFLWQRSPFQLYGPGFGRIETAGIDYLLPYWMGRYYGVVGGGWARRPTHGPIRRDGGGSTEPRR